MTLLTGLEEVFLFVSAQTCDLLFHLLFQPLDQSATGLADPSYRMLA
jgi:hypothetical protein